MASKGKLLCKKVSRLFFNAISAFSMTTYSLFNSFCIQRSNAMKCNDLFLRYIYTSF